MAAVALAAAAPMLFAQGRELFEWNGRVDREVRLVMRGNDVQTNLIGNSEPGRGRIRTFGSLPNGNGQVSVRVMDGRGDVQVIQQPSRQNGFTTIVRVVDQSAGASNYRIAAYWNGSYSNNGDVANGNPNGRDNRDVYRDRRNDDNRGVYNGGATNERGVYNGGVNGANQALRWSGNVDGQLEIRIQNGRVNYRTLSGQQPTNMRADAGNMNMPRGAASVSVVQNQGRGSVSVVQQPSSFNGYTTVIRVNDPQGGYGFYDFSLLWR
jgi:hypothetical protein